MRIVIIEDEKPAAERLRKAIIAVDHSLEPVAVLSSVSSSIRWFNQNPAPDLVFMDIELSDGNGFTILKESGLSCPVIFTTAYDEYWQEAFEHNSLDYLLKPIRQEKLQQAIEKYQKLKLHFVTNYGTITEQAKSNGPKRRFLIKKGADLITLKTEEIAYAYAAHKMAFLVDTHGNKYIQDKSLSEIEEELDPAIFFRINRKWLLNIHHIKRIRTLGKSRLSLELNPPVSEEIIISQENASKFKVWIAG
jgi:two-component system, LytTR family, response regulator